MQNTGRFKFAQAGGEHIRAHSKVTLQMSVALRSVEQPLDDKEGPPCADDVEGRGQVAHAVGSASVFI